MDDGADTLLASEGFYLFVDLWDAQWDVAENQNDIVVS